MNSLDWQERSAESIGESPRRSVLDTSGYSLKLKQNAEQKEGESMFEFLKRRKRYAIEQQISKSRNTRSRCQPPTDRTMLNQTIDDISAMKVSKQLNKTTVLSRDDRDRLSTMSTKKVTFKDQQQTSLQQTTNRTFFQIVSPFKRRAGGLQSFASADITTHDIRIPSTGKKLRGKEQTMQKKSLFGKLEQLMSQVNGYVKDVENYKTKSNAWFVEAVGLLGEVENQYKDRFLKKKIQEIKNSHKTIGRLYENLSISDPREQLSSLTRQLSDSVNSIQAQLKKAYQAEVQQILKAKEEDFKSVVKNYQDQLRKLTKQIESLDFKLNKQMNIENEQSNEQTKKFTQSSKKYQSKAQQLERKILELQEVNLSLQQSLKKSEIICKDLDRENRTLQSDKQSLLKSFQIQKQQIACRKEAYLMEEMATLKKAFQADMANLTELYKMKEGQLMQQMSNLQASLEENDAKLKCSLRSEGTCNEQLALARTQLQKYRMQNDQLVKRLHVTTDQAHLYWSTLKDLKVLSTRLGLYGKFSRLFEQIKFSDSTFR